MFSSQLDSLGKSAVAFAGDFGLSHRGRLEERIAVVGDLDGISANALVGKQVVSAFVFPLVWIYILGATGLAGGLLDGPKQIVVYFLLALAGFHFPVLRINERIKRIHREITLELPDTLDLLTISVEAGLDFMKAMERVVKDKKPSRLRHELEMFFGEVRMGRPRAEVLRSMSDRLQLQDVSNLVSALVQADRLGSPIGPVLRIQSDMMRIRRAQRAEKAAQEAPVKMMAPLIMCIFPSVFLIILGPIIIQALTS